MLALILYEHALTFSDEVSLFWGKRATMVSVFFFANRYSTVLYGVLNLVSGFVSPEAGCIVLTRLTQVNTLLIMMMFGAWSSLRVHALWRVPSCCLCSSLA